MPTITLFHAPGACSRVTMNALEETGAAYEDVPVNILVGEQKSPAYLAVNPKGKVPAVRIDDRLLTENASILVLLDKLYPHAGLLPKEADPVRAAGAVSDLLWCSSTLHPIVRSVRNPARYTDGDTSGVYAKGVELFADQAKLVEAKLAGGGWFYGQTWAIVDVYVAWICESARAGRFDLGPYPGIRDHIERVRARPSFQRALAREESALERGGITLPPGLKL